MQTICTNFKFPDYHVGLSVPGLHLTGMGCPCSVSRFCKRNKWSCCLQKQAHKSDYATWAHTHSYLKIADLQVHSPSNCELQICHFLFYLKKYIYIFLHINLDVFDMKMFENDWFKNISSPKNTSHNYQ